MHIMHIIARWKESLWEAHHAHHSHVEDRKFRQFHCSQSPFICLDNSAKLSLFIVSLIYIHCSTDCDSLVPLRWDGLNRHCYVCRPRYPLMPTPPDATLSSSCVSWEGGRPDTEEDVVGVKISELPDFGAGYDQLVQRCWHQEQILPSSSHHQNCSGCDALIPA